MADAFVQFQGIDRFISSLERASANTNKAAKLAINDTARKKRTEGKKAIRDQVNLKASYVNQNLRLTRKASVADLGATISGRNRPTQLSRYGARRLTKKAKHPERSEGYPELDIPAGRKLAGVSVKVKAGGKRQKMRGAFLLPLNNTDRLGVAVRNGPDQSDYEILYGPSVGQVWRDVREDLAPGAEEQLSDEFIRQLNRFI